MSQSLQTVCDICGAVKGESNHWWSFRQVGAELHVWPATAIIPILSEQKGSDLCSEECCHKALAKWMREQRGIPTAESETKPTLREFPAL